MNDHRQILVAAARGDDRALADLVRAYHGRVYRFGLRVFDSSIAGLGGCPYARGATGNVATEDVVYLLHGLGADTGIDLDALVDCGAWISTALGREVGSRVSRAVMSQRGASSAR